MYTNKGMKKIHTIFAHMMHNLHDATTYLSFLCAFSENSGCLEALLFCRGNMRPLPFIAELVVALEPFAVAAELVVALEPHLKSLTVAIDLCRGKDNYVRSFAMPLVRPWTPAMPGLLVLTQGSALATYVVLVADVYSAYSSLQKPPRNSGYHTAP